jgi:CBS domain-containing protein
MRCEELMNRDIQWVSPRDTVEDAACRMRDQDIGFLPVCDQSRRVVGTLTDRDIAIRFVAEKQPAGTFVEEVMSKESITCKASDDLRTAEQKMSDAQKSRIMCLDDDGKLLGVISLSDLAQHEHLGAAETLREVKEP